MATTTWRRRRCASSVDEGDVVARGAVGGPALATNEWPAALIGPSPKPRSAVTEADLPKRSGSSFPSAVAKSTVELVDREDRRFPRPRTSGGTRMAIQAISRTRRITVVNKLAINLVRRVASPRSIVVDARERMESGSGKITTKLQLLQFYYENRPSTNAK